MRELSVITSQTPGIVSFDNYEEAKAKVLSYVKKYDLADYASEGIKAATADLDELKSMHDALANAKKELKNAYSAPYVTVEKMLDELLAIIDPPWKKAKAFVDNAEKEQKMAEILAYASAQAEGYGEVGKKIVESPAFFKKDWLLKKYKVKNYQEEIDTVLHKAANNVKSIREAPGENTGILLARFYETLSMDGVKSFRQAVAAEQDTEDTFSVASSSNVMGYKILKITATVDQMASIMDQLELMGVEVEEIEDEMPKLMEELTSPDFTSFVAFDIETTGSNGAANGDGAAKITEIGAVRVVNGEVVEYFDRLANPGRDIVPRIARLTHITNEMVADEPPVDEIIRMFHEFVGDSVLVGHNIKSSDLRYIVKAADQAGVHFDGRFLDTYILAKKFKERMCWEKVNLGYLAKQYGFEHKEAHRAWSDAEVNAQVYFELKKLCEGEL